jgi:hypothetical protein
MRYKSWVTEVRTPATRSQTWECRLGLATLYALV